MEAIIHKDIQSLKEILPEYNELKNKYNEITVFHEVQSLINWWDYNKSKEISPYIVEVKTGNETIGVFPLYISEKDFANVKFRILRPIGFMESIYLIPILSKKYKNEQVLRKIMDKIYEEKNDWDCIHWGDLPESSNLDAFLKKQMNLGKNKISRKVTSKSSCIKIYKDMALINKKMSKSFLKEIRKKERKLKQIGDLSYCVVTDQLQIRPIMDKLFLLHCQRWGGTETPSKFESVKEREFMMRIVKNLYKNNLLHLSYLSHNGEIAAIEFGVIDYKTRYMIIGTTNSKFEKYSVGHLMVYKMIEEACAKGYEEMDFLRGNEAYKQKYGPVNTVNLDYLIFNDSIKSRLFKKVHHTYYSKKFWQRPNINRLVTKSMIRGWAYFIRMNDQIKPGTSLTADKANYK